MKLIPQRREKLCRKLRRLQVDAMLVTSVTNVTYLTGFTGDSSYLLVTQDESILLSDTRYAIQIEEECPGLEADIRDVRRTMLDVVARLVNRMKLKTLAIEGDSIIKGVYDQLQAALGKTELVSTSGLVEQLRSIKDRDEIKEIEDAVTLAERAFQVVQASLRPDQTELQIGHHLEHQIRLFGGDCCAFEPIVAVGPRAALPHAVKTDRRMDASPFVLIDWGAKARLYRSDLTRVLVTGKISPKLERIYRVVLNAQRSAIEKIRPGAIMKEVDHAARRIIQQAGHGKHFGHGLGHGIGLEVHETPRLSPSNDAPLQAGMVITIEPGIYLPGWGGVRIEDDVLVTKDGHRVLTSLTTDLEQCVVPFN